MKTKIITLVGVVLVGIGLAGCGCGCVENKGGEASVMTQEAIGNEEPSAYMTFTQERFDALRGNKFFVVFFYADWCGTCRTWDKSMRSFAAELPSDAMVLKANYDTDTELVKALHVKSQSTAVLFDAKGEILNAVMDPSMDDIAEFFTMEADNTFAMEKYQSYSSEARTALSGQKHILFFYADWCSTCRKWQKNVQANWGTLPESTRILRVNYDTEMELKKEFGIKMQSTAVFINEDGSLAETHADPSLKVVQSFFQ